MEGHQRPYWTRRCSNAAPELMASADLLCITAAAASLLPLHHCAAAAAAVMIWW